MSLWKVDPTFTNYIPKTAAEAVDRYVRCRNNGLKAMLIPECLIECARGLKEQEMDKFEQWIINPSGDLSKVELVEQKDICEANDAVFQKTLARVTASMEESKEPETEQEDEKEHRSPSRASLQYISLDDDLEEEALPAIPAMLPLVRQTGQTGRFRFTEC